ncbi:MAG: anti-sigma F factor [Eubacteriales bacterium]|nr:anti-sigma F factor [Eubacteriales bacterium]
MNTENDGSKIQKYNNVLNKVKIKLPAISVNEGAARAMVSVFLAQLNPTIEELADIKCAVSEAITNCIVHAYKGYDRGLIYISITLFSTRHVRIEVRDKGCGIADVKKAREPLFTTDTTGERSGMGFSVMENFTDRLYVSSKVGEGTRVIMIKKLGKQTLD